MQLQEALYNWLCIKKVAEARPNDQAAQETCDFFLDILQEDHQLKKLEVKSEADVYRVSFYQDGEEQTKPFPKPLIDALLRSIEAEPKYNHQ